jgi:ATP-dependent Clp protease ATP-binding subunit ClpC
VISSVDSGSLRRVFEHFTDGARRTLVLAHGEAQSLHASSIGPEHLLLGMVREGEGMAAKALLVAGVEYDRTRAIIGERASQVEPASDPEPFSIATMRIMERCGQISWARADGGIGTEHLLVAILEQKDETTEAVLVGLDITPQEVMQRLNALLGESDR